MAKFCPNCGTAMNDDTAFCPACGTSTNPAAPAAPVAPAAPAAPVAPAPKPRVKPVSAHAPGSTKPADAIQALLDKVKREPKCLIVPGAALAAVIVLVIVLNLVFGGAPYKSALNNLCDLSLGDVKALENVAPQSYWDYMEEENDVSLEDTMDKFEDSMEDALDELEDEYGKKLKISYEVTKEKELSSKKLEKIAEALEDQYEIEDKVKAGYNLDVELTIKGSEDDDTNEIELTVIKLGNKWYIINYYEYNDGYRVSFFMGT